MVSAFHLQPDIPMVLIPAETLKALEQTNTLLYLGQVSK